MLRMSMMISTEIIPIKYMTSEHEVLFVILSHIYIKYEYVA